MKRTLCEQIAAPILVLHRKTSTPLWTGTIALAAAGLGGYGLVVGNPHFAWAGVLGMIIGWYGFLLHGCDRLLVASEGKQGSPTDVKA